MDQQSMIGMGDEALLFIGVTGVLLVLFTGVRWTAQYIAPYVQAIALLFRARNSLSNGHPSLEILQLLSRAIRLHPRLALAYVLRGQVWCRLGADERAMEDVNTAVRLSPRNYRAYMVRAWLHDYFGNYQQAIDDLRTAILCNPDWHVGYLDLALHYLALGDAAHSLEVLERLSMRRRGRALRYDALVMAGQVYEENLNDFDAAVRSYSLAVALEPRRRVAYLMRAWALRSRGHYRAAAEDLLSAAKCPRPVTDQELYGWLQAQHDSWLYLVAHDPDERDAWRAVLQNGDLVYITDGDYTASDPQIFLN
jgi:tetratricopeptide (TPR) repeat protein